MTSFALFGSSYISRLMRHCDGDLQISGINTQFFGRGGLRTDRMDEELLRRAVDTRADYVFLHIGGNDISPSSKPRDIFERIVELVNTFKAGGTQVVWASWSTHTCKIGQLTPHFWSTHNLVNSHLWSTHTPGQLTLSEVQYHS